YFEYSNCYYLCSCIRSFCILFYHFYMFIFFFFQAEDGIRDLTVTGVQTCALPISQVSKRLTVRVNVNPSYTDENLVQSSGLTSRSEERRVGKECRSRWSACHSKKKKKRKL